MVQNSGNMNIEMLKRLLRCTGSGTTSCSLIDFYYFHVLREQGLIQEVREWRITEKGKSLLFQLSQLDTRDYTGNQ